MVREIIQVINSIPWVRCAMFIFGGIKDESAHIHLSNGEAVTASTFSSIWALEATYLVCIYSL